MLFTSTQVAPSKRLPNAGATRVAPPALAPGQRSSVAINLAPLQGILLSLTRSCAEALVKSVQHFEGEDAWGIGAMPNCSTPADNLEAEARSLLCNSLLTPDQTTDVTVCLKVAADLRAVARSAQQAAQLSWLFRQMPNATEATAIVLPVGEAACQVALRASEAVEKNDPLLAREAALLYRKVDVARIEAEQYLYSELGSHNLSPELRRMVLAAIWFMAIAGEAMARIAARVAL